ncbi:response regulator [Pseudomonas aeruginosa]|nr:response regulator [Pseudomonas aeruginosa]
MGDRHDYVALEWVKGEIAETLKQARQALEAFVENPQDPTRMRFCLTYVHQVQGTLQMVEFYGAALLAEEMEQLVQALLDGRVPNQGEALEVLMQAILQLPVYLDRIQTARRDLPMVVLPLLNDLRAARGEKLLSETSLFAPDLSQRQPQLDGEAIAQLRTDELGGLLRKLRQTQQMALVGLLRNQDVATSLGYLARVYARLEGLCREAPLGPLWSIASGLVEGLANGSVVNSASVRTLLRQLDRELKRLVEQGADGLNQAAPDELVKNLLFYVAKAPSQSPRIRALKEQYRLDEALPDHETVDAERARLAGPDRDAMRSVVGALCEELVRIKDSLDLFVRSDRGHPSELDALLAPLKQIADTLAVLGFGQPRKVILDQLDVIHALAQGRREPSDAILMDVAGALLYVEATLAGMAGPGDERNSEESRLPTTDVAQIHQLVIKEARNGLEQAKDAIIEFIASQWNHEHLARVPELLTQVRGGLAMIPLERAATLLETCNRYIQEQLLARKAVPDWQSLDTLADAITSVEYYLERLSEDHASQSDLILDVAEDSLANLGYTLKPNSSAPAEPGLSGPAAIESPAAEPERPEAVVEVAETAEQPPADTAPAEAAREDAPLLASDDNWTLGEVAPDAGEPSLDLALDLPLDDSAEVPPALPEVVEESGQPQSTPAPARSLDDFSLDEIDLSGLDLPADAAPASGPAALADWSLPEQWGLGDDLAQPAQAGETLDLSLEEPALSFDAPLESLEPLPALEPFDGSAEQELVLDALDPLPLDVALPEAEGEVSAWEGSSLEELDLSDLDLPEVQLPEAEAEAPPAAEALASEAPALSLAEVMAAPVQPINPPAQNVPVSLLPPPADEEPVDEELREVFIEEADDLLENLELALGRWDGGNGDAQPLDDLLRILHTLKGGARLAGQTELGNLAHDLEQHLTDAQQQGAPWPDSLLLDAQSGLEGLQRQVDLLRERLAEDDEAGERPDPAQALVQADDTDRAVASALAELTRLAPAAGAIMAAEAAPPAAPATTLPFVRKAQEAAQEAASRRAPQELVKVPAELLENLVNLAGETSIFRGRVEQQVSDVGFTLGEMESTIERVRDQLRRLDTETQAQILSRHQADAERAGYEEFDPLEMDRYSQLQQLSRALFESASDLLDLKETLAAKNRDAETLLLQQARVNTELQEGLMRTRMVPFDRLVPRLRRIVRQVAGELGKQVEFVVGNADGEMDRTVLERIVAPLEHMLRNAVDHGIESGETRRAAGKPEHGTIRLNIGREGGDILLTLSDDGAGIRLDAVRRKAIERGLMSADSDLSDHEVLQFVLESGFSTAEKVTQISGRGVGLDVANSEVKQLGGSVSIQTEPGQGTRFNVRLPFTVSVNRALMVLSGEDLYAVPLNTIEGIVRVSPYELEALYDQRGEAGLDTPSFEYAGQSYELKYLGELLNNGQEPKLVGQSLPLPVILVRSSEHAVAVQVDSLAGSREIVVKSLGPQFAGVAGISGATLLGDGRVVVILDLLATIRSRHALLGQENRRERLALRQEMAASESEQQRPPLVMVVDDSVTVRKVTTRLLERNGMNVLTAKDGVDAIAQLQEHRPDILLLDIEMPRMDGFEVATLVRHDERLGNLPIIMITSRTGEKHRERALGIGVNQYLGKPYQETELLEAIQSLVGQHE